MQAKAPLLFIFAHPDDESFTCGGSMTKYAAAGHPVHLVCATRGEVGEMSDPALATPETLGHVREQELRAACRIMGTVEPVFLGYRDSGMIGTPENQDARAFYQARPATVVEQITGIIRKVRPAVVVTFDEFGGYGHPDHITVHKHATAAFFAAGRADSFPHQFARGLQAWSPEKLYYSTIPQRRWRQLMEGAKAHGIEPPPFLADITRNVIPDETVRTELDVADSVKTKLAAIAAHKTQYQPNNPFTSLPEDLTAQFQGVEFYQRVFPGYTAGEAETDLLG